MSEQIHSRNRLALKLFDGIARNYHGPARAFSLWQDQDVHRLLESVLQLVKLHPNANAIEIRLSFQEDPLLVEASAQQLKQVFYNVASNAFDEMATGGVLSLRTDSNNL